MIKDAPIEKVYIHYNNDPSVGMFPYSYELNVHVTDRDTDNLKQIKEKISELYELIDGEKPDSIMFDFELESELKHEADYFNRMENEIELDRQKAEMNS